MRSHHTGPLVLHCFPAQCKFSDFHSGFSFLLGSWSSPAMSEPYLYHVEPTIQPETQGMSREISGTPSLCIPYILASSSLFGPTFQSPSPQLRRTALFCMGYPSWHHRLGNTSRQKAGWSWGSPHLFPFSQESWSCTACWPTPENSYFIHFVHLYGFLKVEVPICYQFSIMAGSRSANGN